MKNTGHYYYLFRRKAVSVLFLLFFTLLIQAKNENKKLDILISARSEIEKETDKQTKQVIATLDSVIKLKELSDQDFANITFRIGELFREQGTLPPAIELFFTTIFYFEQNCKPTKEIQKILVSLYIPLGASHEELGMWNQAMDFYLKALKLAEELNSESHKAMIYNNIGAIYCNRTESDKAEIYFKKALEINLKQKNKKELFNNYNNLAGVYYIKKDYDQALDCSLRAIQVLDNRIDSYLYYFMQANISTLYLQKKDYKLSISYLKNAMKYQEQFHFAYDLIETYHTFTRIYGNINQHDSAQFYIDKTLKQMEIVQNKYLESRILQNIATYYKEIANYKKAYQALEKSAQLKDSIQQVDNRKKIDNLERVYDADKKIKENEALIKEISLKKTASDRLWIIMFTIALLLVMAILFLINRVQNKEKIRKANEVLIQQKTFFYEKENQLQKQKEQEMSKTIDQKNRELTSYTLRIAKNNEFMTDLAEELKKLLLELKPKDRGHKEHVRQILNKLHHQNCTSTNWNEFRYFFEQVHPSFYEDLEKYFPDLTMKEKRLCAFLRLGLSSKEISAITFKEIRSVETARNRLRKKLNLTSEGNLTDFLCYNIFFNSIQE